MFKLKIVHKGLFFVCVPLIVGMIVNLLLCYGFNLANRFAERGLMFKEASISYVKSTRCSALARVCAMSYMSSHDPYYKEHYQATKKDSADADKHLHKLLSKEKNLVIPDLTQSSRELIQHGMQAGSVNTSSSSPFLEELQKNANGEGMSAKHAMDSLQHNLLWSIFILATVSVLLAVFFCLNITNRLLLILGNTVSLTQGTPLRPPLKGQDEIAELDQLLYKSATEIRELERFKKEMIGVVSHELKSPLSSVGSFLSSLSAGVYGALSEKVKDKVDRTYGNVKRLMGLVAELLVLDRLELDMKPEKIDAGQVLSTAVDSVKELSEKTGIEIVVKNEVHSEILVDRNRLVQVLVNLLSNAMKFSPQDGAVILEAREGDGYFECRVSDQGRGIPESFRKQIFEPFQQVDSKDATTKKGTGLGLTISKSIVEQHGGKIDVESEEGKGSTFWFRIPLDPANVVGRQEQVAHEKSPSVIAGKPAGLAFDLNNAGGKRKFSVLQQGLVIISVPLIFQITFVAVLAYMVDRVHHQTSLEEHSQEVLKTLNKSAEQLVASVNAGTMYSYTKSPVLARQWQDATQSALDLLDQAKGLCKDDAQAQKDIDETKLSINKVSDAVNAEAKSENTSQGLQQLVKMAGLGDAIGGQNPIQFMMGMQGRFGPQGGEFGGFGARGGRQRHEAFPTHEDGPQQEQSNDTSTPFPGGKPLPDYSPDPPRVRSGSSPAVSAHIPGNAADLPPSPLPQTDTSGGGSRPLREGRGMPGMEQRQEMMEKVLSHMGGSSKSEGVGKIRRLMQAMGGMGMGAPGGGVRMNFGGGPDDDPMSHMGDMSKIAQLLSSFGGRGAAGPMGMMSHIENVLNKSVQVKIVRPLLEAESAQNDLMNREKALGEKLSIERATMVRNLQITLAAGMLLNVGVSVFLAMSVMKKLTGRLQHLMENTARLAKREPLAPPKAGHDEIAYLDKILFEAGNHLIDLENFKKELISIVSHELRTPLMSICSALELFAAGTLGELSEKGKHPPEKGTIKVLVEPSVEHSLKFSVVDRGRGIPSELSQKIFDRFVQVEDSDATVKGGSGLGLAISKAIVEQHGGIIGVESVMGLGSEFWFKLPITQSSASAAEPVTA